MKTALVFGAGGQAGYYLCDLLRRKAYDDVLATTMDVTDRGQIELTIRMYKPDEIYNLASKMYAPASWFDATGYIETNFNGVLNILEAIRQHSPKSRFFQAGSAEVFDIEYGRMMSENTPMKPRNPYGVAKEAAQQLVALYRQQYNLFACTGIFFNMESPRRKDSFFVPKVVHGVTDLKLGRLQQLKLGKLNAVRDWGLTEEYVEAAWMMLNTYAPNDYVIGTGEGHSCLELVRAAFAAVNIPATKGYLDYEPGSNFRFDAMVADPTKIKRELGWQAKTKMHALVRYLVSVEIERGQSIAAG